MKLFVLAGSMLAAMSVAGVAAQEYPTRPVRLIVPFAPGGSVDVVGRLVGQRLSESLGQAVVIDNRGGAGGVIGSEIASKSTPDGYTLLLSNNSTHGVNQAMNDRLPYDALRDFTHVSQLASAPHLLLTAGAFPAKSVRDLIELAKSRPGKIHFGSGGTGSQSHLSGELFANQAGIQLTHVPYKGSGPAGTALLSGEIQLLMSGVLGSTTHVQAGRLRALGIMGVKRSPLLPAVPTFGEQGIKNLEVGPWYGISGPARLPPAVVRRLHEHVVIMVRNAEFRDRVLAQGAEPVGGTPEEFTQVVRNELAKWARLVKEVGLRSK